MSEDYQIQPDESFVLQLSCACSNFFSSENLTLISSSVEAWFEMTKPQLRHDEVEGGKKAVSHEGEEEDMWTAHDDVTGKELDPEEVVKARAVELGYIAQKGVWVKMLRSEAKRRSIRIVGTRWLDINKGDEEVENYRSRLVAKDFNQGKEEGIFAATPPLEALKLLISDVATVGEKGTEEKILMVNDVARAFFEADMRKE